MNNNIKQSGRLIRRGNFKFMVSKEDSVVTARFIGVTDKILAQWYPNHGRIIGTAKCNLLEDKFSFSEGSKRAINRCMKSVVDYCNQKLMKLSRRLSTEEMISFSRNNRKQNKKLASNKTDVSDSSTDTVVLA